MFLRGFRFDPDSGRLWHMDEEIPLRPKASAVLALLVSRPGELVTKAELLAGAWADGFVGDGALAVCVNELRQALGDNPRTPQFIATVHRRGYRLVIEPSAVPPPVPQSDGLFVGRRAELATLSSWWQQADSRLVLGFLVAQAGAGKTALVTQAVSRIREHSGALVGVGQCLDDVGAGEPYLPVLDALVALCRGPGGAGVVDVLRRFAPSWLAQLPGYGAIDPRVLRAPASRMVREFAAAMLELSARHRVLLVLEDLQDADRSTVTLLTYLARCGERLRLLVIGTFRSDELVARDHGLKAAVQDLATHRLCHQLALGPLSDGEIGEYVTAWFAPRTPPADLISELAERTEGNALFVTAVCRHLTDQGVPASDEGGGRPLAELDVPGEVRLMLQRRVDALAERDRRMLMVAAVVGVEFTAAAVSAGLGERVTLVQVEERCDRLALAGSLVSEVGSEQWPDGTLTARYRFAHAMYREVLYRSLGPARRAQVHHEIGTRLAAGYGERIAQIAGELAWHFECGRDYPAAVAHVTSAASRALARSAYAETHERLRHGLQLLGSVRDQNVRTRLEVGLLRTRVVAMAAVWDWQLPDAYADCLRLLELARGCGDVPATLTALLGLHNVAMMRSDAAGRRRRAEQVGQLALQTGDVAAQLVWHLLEIQQSSRIGDCVVAWQHAQRMLELYRPDEHADLAVLVGEEPNVAANEFAATALWQLGHPDQARRHAAAAIDAAIAQDIPVDVARALWFAGVVHLLCGDAARVTELTTELAEVCTRHGLRLWAAGGDVLGGWARATLTGGSTAVRTGIARMQTGMAGWAAFAQLGATFHCAVAGEVYLGAEMLVEARAAVRDGLAAVRHDGERQSEPELLRLHAELLRREGDRHGCERALRHAWELAEHRGARGFQLRLATSLARLHCQEGDPARAVRALRGVYDTFTEGHDTRDLRAAAVLLAQLRSATG